MKTITMEDPPIHQAVARNNVDQVVRLLQGGADPNAVCFDGYTPLSVAAKNGYDQVVRRLLEHGADPRVVNRWNYTPLADAVVGGHAAVVARLLRAGARGTPVNPLLAFTLARTPDFLRLLALHGTLDMLRALSREGLAAVAVDGDGRTVLHHLAEARETSPMVGDLYGAVHVADQWGRTPLHYAAMFGREGIARELLDIYADPSARDRDGRTPLDLLRHAGYGAARPALARLLRVEAPTRPG